MASDLLMKSRFWYIAVIPVSPLPLPPSPLAPPEGGHWGSAAPPRSPPQSSSGALLGVKLEIRVAVGVLPVRTGTGDGLDRRRGNGSDPVREEGVIVWAEVRRRGST